MMGMPNFRFRLPSRNWMIFLTVVGSWTTAVMYDRRQKKAIQKKWCDLVADIAQQTSNPRELPRTLNVILAAPPGDSLGTSQVYFKEYIKPILIAAALEYDLIQGRREGDVRYGVAEQIRRLRRKQGEKGTGPEPEADGEQLLEGFRQQVGVYTSPGVKGDVVIGRHTWKEYVRGLHEGWLGPLDPPPEPAPEPTPLIHSESSPDTPTVSTTEQTEEQKKQEEEKKNVEEDKKKEEEKKKNERPSAYIPASAYSSAPLSPHTPSLLEPSQAFHQYHLLGFLKTPIRMWNFLNQRKLADDCGRQAAAVVLAAYRPYQHDESFASTSSEADASPRLATQMPENDADVVQTNEAWEQQAVNAEDELTWHKSIRKPKKVDPTKEQIWMADMVLDPRIASRMRRFELEPEQEARAARIERGEEQGRAIPVNDLEEQKSLIGNLDDENA